MTNCDNTIMISFCKKIMKKRKEKSHHMYNGMRFFMGLILVVGCSPLVESIRRVKMLFTRVTILCG
jgi:hypothetical protein